MTHSVNYNCVLQKQFHSTALQYDDQIWMWEGGGNLILGLQLLCGCIKRFRNALTLKHKNRKCCALCFEPFDTFGTLLNYSKWPSISLKCLVLTWKGMLHNISCREEVETLHCVSNINYFSCYCNWQLSSLESYVFLYTVSTCTWTL